MIHKRRWKLMGSVNLKDLLQVTLVYNGPNYTLDATRYCYSDGHKEWSGSMTYLGICFVFLYHWEDPTTWQKFCERTPYFVELILSQQWDKFEIRLGYNSYAKKHLCYMALQGGEK